MREYRDCMVFRWFFEKTQEIGVFWVLITTSFLSRRRPWNLIQGRLYYEKNSNLGKGSVLGFVLGFCIPPKLSPNKSVKKSLYPGINA